MHKSILYITCKSTLVLLILLILANIINISNIPLSRVPV